MEYSLVASDPCSCRRAMISCVGWLVMERLPFPLPFLVDKLLAHVCMHVCMYVCMHVCITSNILHVCIYRDNTGWVYSQEGGDLGC